MPDRDSLSAHSRSGSCPPARTRGRFEVADRQASGNGLRSRFGGSIDRFLRGGRAVCQSRGGPAGHPRQRGRRSCVPDPEQGGHFSSRKKGAFHDLLFGLAPIKHKMTARVSTLLVYINEKRELRRAAAQNTRREGLRVPKESGDAHDQMRRSGRTMQILLAATLSARALSGLAANCPLCLSVSVGSG